MAQAEAGEGSETQEMDGKGRFIEASTHRTRGNIEGLVWFGFKRQFW